MANVTKEECYQTQKAFMEKLDEIKTDLTERINEVKLEIADIPNKLDERYASKLFEKIVYGMIGLILLAFAGKLIALVIK